mgnify:CR=1 FL=1
MESISRAEWVLGGLLVVLLVIVAGLGLLFWLQPDFSQPPALPATNLQAGVAPTPAFAGETALAASVSAQDVATNWQADAQLVGASATWPQGASLEVLRDGASAWTFNYYSVAAQETAVLSVIDGNATLLQTFTAEIAPEPLNVTGWKIDSALVVDTIFREGGTAFAEQEQVITMFMELKTNSDDSRLEWLVTLIGEQSGRSLTLEVDATTGVILERYDPS